MKLSCSLLYFAALGQLHHFGTAATTESYPGGSNQVSWCGTSTSEIRHVGRPQWEKYVVVWGTRRVRYFPLSGAPYIHRTTGRGILRGASHSQWGEAKRYLRAEAVVAIAVGPLRSLAQYLTAGCLPCLRYFVNEVGLISWKPVSCRSA